MIQPGPEECRCFLYLSCEHGEPISHRHFRIRLSERLQKLCIIRFRYFIQHFRDTAIVVIKCRAIDLCLLANHGYIQFQYGVCFQQHQQRFPYSIPCLLTACIICLVHNHSPISMAKKRRWVAAFIHIVYFSGWVFAFIRALASSTVSPSRVRNFSTILSVILVKPPTTPSSIFL